LQELARSLSNRLQIWDEGRGFPAIREAWSQRALGLGGEVTAMLGTKEIRGVFTGLAADGALLLTAPDGAVTPIHSGEVKFAELESLRRRTQ
jgi:BirA family transcriptional regulator, biotin operon repressor / biotin---[acetyl-CoA-carboxylase] ligase